MALFDYNTLIQDFNYYKSYDYMVEGQRFVKAESIQINDTDQFDIFLSHSYADRKIIPSIKEVLEGMGFKVYVDWINDKLLSRENVSKTTAEILQKRMQQSKSLFFATSENSPSSKWMPWELGYFDGKKDKRVAILPIKTENNDFKEDFEGQEYLGLYYYVTIDDASKLLESHIWAMEKNAFNKMYEEMKKKKSLYIHKDSSTYTSFYDWVSGEKPMKKDEKILHEFNKILKETSNGK